MFSKELGAKLESTHLVKKLLISEACKNSQNSNSSLENKYSGWVHGS